jgi:DNA-binding XRE family transcriptional regulator
MKNGDEIVPYHTSGATFLLRDLEVRIKFRSQWRRKHRRAVLLALFRAAKEHIRHLVLYDLYHNDESVEARISRLIRGLKGTDALARTTEAQEDGYMIRILRTKCGLTQKELAKLAGVDQSFISRIEHAQRIPTEKMKPILNLLIHATTSPRSCID